jgi:hypothetical protein
VKDPPYNAVGDGQADDAAAIQAAIDACPEGQVVHVPAGTYRVTQTIYLLKGVILRGDGPATTHIEGDKTPNWAILNLGEQWDESNTPITSIQSGYTKGSKSVVVADASNFAVGGLVNIDQHNDGDLVWVTGSESACTYGSRENGQRLIGQIVEVTSVDTASGAIGFEPALAWDYQASLQPEMERVHSHITKYAGIEDLGVKDRTYRGDNNANVRIHACEYCWAKNIDSDMVSGRHIQVVRSLRCALLQPWRERLWHRRRTADERHPDSGQHRLLLERRCRPRERRARQCRRVQLRRRHVGEQLPQYELAHGRLFGQPLRAPVHELVRG